jgi:hypothetical protein
MDAGSLEFKGLVKEFSTKMQGRLWKKGKLNTQWQPRIFVWDDDNCNLIYYGETDTTKKRGDFGLTEVRDVPDRPNKTAHRIDFVSDEGQLFEVYAESDHDKQLWMAALATKQKSGRHKTSTLMVQASDSVWKVRRL